ncbi:MAG: InlB B-repeat-containing protein [Terracidiphilus sp.]
MKRILAPVACALALGLCLGSLIGCGGSSGSTTPPPPPTTYALTVDSTNPASGVAITVSPADINSGGNGTTSFTRTYDSGASVTLTAPATSGSNTFSSWTGCTSASTVTCTVSMTANATVTANYATPPPITYTLTVDSIDPTSGVAITVSPADNNAAGNGTTSFTRTYNTGTTVTLTAPATFGSNTFSSWTGCTPPSTTSTCTVSMTANTTVTANYVSPPPPNYLLTVNSTDPASGVAITVSPADDDSQGNGTTPFTRIYNTGTSVTLTAPATSGTSNFSSWTGCTPASTTSTCTVSMTVSQTVTANYVTPVLILPTVTVTPGSSAITTLQPLTATVGVSGGAGNPPPTGSVTLTSGTYTSAATTLASGSAQINIPAGSLAVGSDTLSASYTPDSASSTTYKTATGISSTVTVTLQTGITVNESISGPAVSDQLLGMNMAAWYDVVGNSAAVNSAFAQAGIKALRWPGGSWSDEYHWQTPNSSSNPSLPYECANNSSGVPNGSTGWGGYSTFAQFVTNIVQGGGYDLALTADYGTNAACTGPGDPTEAAAWVTAALTDGITVSHMTVGNEEYGTWETDLHSSAHNGATYATAVAGTGGYYPLIKAASPNTLVGVDVEPSYAPWDQDVMSAKGYYDFVEYHFYPETPGSESDTFLVQQAAQELTTNINTIKSELTKWGTPNTPIYVGEIGGPYSSPGKQSWSITQGLYAGQVLGEMMNDGVTRLTWWIGFGNCNGTAGNDSASLYGWQDFGAYNVFSDGPSDGTCPNAGALGSMSPTARAFQLFSNVAVNGESVLTATVAGDTTDVVAYAATHSGGTALVLFNRNETVSEPVLITLSGQSAATTVTVITYDKAIYDLSGSPTGVFPDPSGTNTWAAPTTTNLGAQTLPLTLTLTPWSMNVVLIH